MIRTRVKGNGTKAAASPSTEPNFYAMESCPPDLEVDAKPVSVPDLLVSLPPRQADDDESDVAAADHPGYRIEDYASDEDMDFFTDSDSEIFLTPLDGTSLVGVFDETLKGPAPSWGAGPPLDMTGNSKHTTPFQATSGMLPPPSLISPVQNKRDKLVQLTLNFPTLDLSQPALSFELWKRRGQGEDLVSSLSFRRGETLHSGDEVFFEGLPFHYLDTIDVERALSDVHRTGNMMTGP